MTSYKEFFAIHIAVFGIVIGACYWATGDPNALYGGGLAFLLVTGLNLFLMGPGY